MGANNYMDSSKLEQFPTTTTKLKLPVAENAGGFSREELRKRFGMKPIQFKKVFCLKCEKEFQSLGERICRNCSKGRWDDR